MRTRQVVRAMAVAVTSFGLLSATAAPAGAVTGFAGPVFGITGSAGGGLLAADAGFGVVAIDTEASAIVPVAVLPGVTDVAETGDGDLWAITGGGEGGSPCEPPGARTLYRVAGSEARAVADLCAYEEKHDPHPATVDSNPFDVADLGGGAAAVADAGGNTLLKVTAHGKVKLLAVLPDEVVSTANIKTLLGCPGSRDPLCDLPPAMPAEAVATSVALGPDGAFYVGELKGFPAPTGESRIWRIEANARNTECGRGSLCSVAFDGFTSVIDLAFGPDGRLYVAEMDELSWVPVEFGLPGAGGTIDACDLATGVCEEVATGIPALSSIAFDSDGDLWAVQNVLTTPEVIAIT